MPLDLPDALPGKWPNGDWEERPYCKDYVLLQQRPSNHSYAARMLLIWGTMV